MLHYTEQIQIKLAKINKLVKLAGDGMRANGQRGNVDKVNLLIEKLSERLAELTDSIDEDIKEFSKVLCADYPPITTFKELMDIARFIVQLGENEHAYYVINLAKMIAESSPKRNYITEDLFLERYGLHKRQLQTNEYQLRKFRTITKSYNDHKVTFYEDVPPDEADLAEINEITLLSQGDIEAIFRCEGQTISALLLLGGVNHLSKDDLPDWAKGYKTSWYRFNEIMTFKSWLLEQGEPMKGHNVIVLNENLKMCISCGKAWKSSPRNVCKGW